MKFHELPLGACYKRGKATAIKTGAATCQRVDGRTCAVKPSSNVNPSLCNIRPLIELGSVRRTT